MTAPLSVERKPRHGDIVVVKIPTRITRRRWCATCHVWTWEIGGFSSGVFRHGQKTRHKECR